MTVQDVKMNEDSIDDSWVSLVPLRLSLFLPNLRKLTFTHVSFCVTHPTYSKALAQFKSVSNLTLFKTSFTSFSQFMRVLLTFPRLSILRILNVNPWKDRAWRTNIVGALRRKKISLEDLTLDVVEKDLNTDIAHFILKTPSAHLLKEYRDNRYETYPEDELDMPPKQQLMSNISATLREVQLSFNKSINDNLDLREHHNLHILRLSWVGNSVGFIPSLCQLLSGLGSTCVEEIHLTEAPLKNAAGVIDIDCSPLEKLLSTAKFAHLTKVTIEPLLLDEVLTAEAAAEIMDGWQAVNPNELQIDSASEAMENMEGSMDTEEERRILDIGTPSFHSCTPGIYLVSSTPSPAMYGTLDPVLTTTVVRTLWGSKVSVCGPLRGPKTKSIEVLIA